MGDCGPELDGAWKPAPPAERRSLSPKAQCFSALIASLLLPTGTPGILSWTICGRIAVGLGDHKVAGWDDSGLWG